MPVLKTTEGYLFESNSIMRYLARLNKACQLYGSSLFEEALVDQWLDFANSEVEPAFAGLFFGILGVEPMNPSLAP